MKNVTENVQNGLLLYQMSIWVRLNVSVVLCKHITHSYKDVNMTVKRNPFFYGIQSFIPKLTKFFENFTKNSNKRILQLNL